MSRSEYHRRILLATPEVAMTIQPWVRVAGLALLAFALAACRSLPAIQAAPVDVSVTAPGTPVPIADTAVAPVPAAAPLVFDNGQPRGEYPASFEGTLSCADCRGHQLTLNLFADGVYFLRETWLGRAGGDETYDDIGRWSAAPDRKTIELHGGRETPLRFQRADDGALLALDAAGPASAPGEQRLARDVAFRDLEPRLPLRGLYRHLGDTATFTECLTGRTMPVALEGNYLDTEKAYAALDKTEGQAFLVTVEGRIAERAKTIGDGTQDVLVVDRQRRFWPKEGCGPRYSEARLEDTRWKLAQLGDQPVLAGVSPQEASLTLDSATKRLQGSSGCNRINAGYTVDDGVLRLTPVVATRMACPANAMIQESAFLAMLGKVVLATVAGQQLEFRDGAGHLIARFDAMPGD
jgi:copper homeostasis protein (lipoprotein)